MSASAYVSEIFSTIQGEGPFTGEKQIFVRLAGCPLRCNYCDTPGSLTAQGHPSMSVTAVIEAVLDERRRGGAGTVSVTGGEPLVYGTFLAELLPALKAEGLRTYLETAGVHPEALSRVIDHCDVVSMDIKLPSATGREYWGEHSRFLSIAGPKAFVKVVLEKRSLMEELRRAVGILKENKTLPVLVLQPATGQAPDVEPASADFIAEAYQWCAGQVPDVRVLPQQHKIWKIR